MRYSEGIFRIVSLRCRKRHSQEVIRKGKTFFELIVKMWGQKKKKALPSKITTIFLTGLFSLEFQLINPFHKLTHPVYQFFK